MSASPKTESTMMSPLQKAALALRAAERKIKKLEQAQTEPIAVVGMACRFPGSPSIEAYRSLLQNGTDAISEVPSERWSLEELFDPNPSAVGKINTRFGGFIENVDQFDASFFGIAPLEARLMDPQQRLGLELVWHALEDSGLRPSDLRGSKTGVFVGVTQNDYGVEQLSGNREDIRAFSGTGNGFCFTAGRIAFQYGFKGPVSAVDTACSSSLVALNQACSALRSGDCDLAVVVGMQLNLTPPMQIFLSRTQSFSPTGRCRAFDADSDGFILGEGLGVVVLARETNLPPGINPPRATLLNCAVNHDGPASGLTVPNQKAQEELISGVLEKSKIAPANVSYIETHGTGTQLGDPIEIGALRTALGRGAEEESLYIGSVKANIGHLSAAAGIASLIKAVIMIEENEIFPQIHFKKPNPNIPWLDFNVAVSTARRTLCEIDKKPIIGVSGFGLSGTNAHALLRRSEFKVASEANRDPRQPCFIALSAKSLPALRTLASDHLKRVTELGTDEAFRDYCIANNVRRDTLSIRHLLVADNQTQALDKLTSLISKIDHQKFERPSSGEIAFGLLGSPFFTSDLKESFQDFRNVKDEWDIKLQKSNVDPALAEKFSSGLALLQLWKRFGIETDYFAVDEWQKSTALMLLDISSEKNWIQSNDQYVPSRRAEFNEWDENIVEVDSDSENQDQAVERLVDLGVKTLIMLGRDDSLERPLREIPTLELTATDNFWGYVASGLKLAYEGGQNINWRVVHGGVNGRISLPHYPFEKTRFWLETGTEAKATPAKDQSERHSLASGSNPIEAVFREQWLELTRQTSDLAARQFLQYQQMLGSNDHVGNIDSVESPELICQGNWRLIVLNGTDSRQILASAQAFPVSLPDQFEANFQSVKSQGDTDGLIGAAVVWEAENHESVSVDIPHPVATTRILGTQLGRPLTMIFAGVGDHYLNMGSDLYEGNERFRNTFDQCAQLITGETNQDIREILFKKSVQPKSGNKNQIDLRAMLGRDVQGAPSSDGSLGASALDDTVMLQPLMFAFDYSLASMWADEGVHPDFLIGYSIGEYVAACLSGVFTLPDALRIVARRAQSIGQVEKGGLLAVPLDQLGCREFIGDEVFVGITSGAKQTILSGSMEGLNKVSTALKQMGLTSRFLPGTHPFHSPLLKPACPDVEALIASVQRNAPTIPVISNVTGVVATSNELQNPKYWSDHTCSTVKFTEGLDTLLRRGEMDFLEVGPGRSLGSFVMQHPEFNKNGSQNVMTSVRGKWENFSDDQIFLETLGVLRVLGHQKKEKNKNENHQ